MRVPFILLRTLPRLLRNLAGNVAIMAAFAVIPLLAMVGGAIDTSRTYMAYTRLQQACDAGALAGRKAMSNVTRLTDAEKAKAGEFFRFNFPAGTYSAEQITAVYDKGANGVVVGRASLSMPTTLMRMFGFGSIPVSTTCQAELNIPNTDIMFVLDVTGSMDSTPAGDPTSDETQKRIYGLKQAVRDFYAALGPGPASGPGRIRYGFVPYNSNVNVGRTLYALNPSYLVGGTRSENWTYSSRQGQKKRGYCQDSAGNYYTCDYVAWTRFNRTFDVNPYVTTQNSMNNPAYWQGDPTGWNYNAPSSFSWSGCIEEATTVNTIDRNSSLEVPFGADDLQIDLKPTTGDSRWKPAMGSMMYSNKYTAYIVADPCPTEAKKLLQYTSDYNANTKSSTSFNAYVDALSADGGTYHDIGLMWGARFLSANGIFSSTNSDSVAPGGFAVSRHIVFMTDGELSTTPQAADAWGVNEVNGRVVPTNADKTRLDESHLRRTQIICNEMKKRGFIIWIVGFGTDGLSPELKACATDDDHWSIAADTTALRRTFSKIAQTIGGLRLSS